ncbi:MAG: hypothetical protein RL277_1671, partial [Planctomycetota bacterium]
GPASYLFRVESVAIATAVAATATAVAAAATATAAATTVAAAAAAAATEATAAAAAAAEAATAATAGLTLLGFVHAQRAAVKSLSVPGLDGSLSIGIAAHGDEREAARAPGLAIRDNSHFTHLASVGCKGGLEVRFSGVE